MTPKLFRFCLLLLILGLMSCHPYAPMDRLEKEVFLQFPYEQYAQKENQLDTLVYYTPVTLTKNLTTIETFSNRLAQIQPTDKWTTDKQALYQELSRYLSELETYFLAYQKDPSIYNLGGRLVQVLNQPKTNTEKKSSNCLQLLEGATQFYRTAQQCLQQAEPDRLKLAIQKQLATLQLLEGELVDSLRQWNLPSSQAQQFDKALYIANLSCKDYVAYCNSLLFEHRDAGLFSKD